MCVAVLVSYFTNLYIELSFLFEQKNFMFFILLCHCKKKKEIIVMATQCSTEWAVSFSCDVGFTC